MKKSKSPKLETKRPYSRLVIFSLDLGLACAILLLYSVTSEGILVVVLLLTASVVAASRDDLTELKSDKTLILTIVCVAIAVFVISAYSFPPYDMILFYSLIAINSGLLVTYAVMRLAARRNSSV